MNKILKYLVNSILSYRVRTDGCHMTIMLRNLLAYVIAQVVGGGYL